MGHPQFAQPQQFLLTNSVVGATYTEADAVQHLLQGFFGIGLCSVGFAFAVSAPGRGALFRQQVDVDEFKGAHLVVELPCPGPDGRLLNDVDEVSFLYERGGMSFRLSHHDATTRHTRRDELKNDSERKRSLLLNES